MSSISTTSEISHEASQNSRRLFHRVHGGISDDDCGCLREVLVMNPMKHLRYVLIALGLLWAGQADAATCFWVGTGGAAGGGSYTTTNAVNWASSSNGANSSCAAVGGVPKNSADVATFDSAANGIGSGTVTLDSSMNGVTITTLNVPTGTGTINTNGQNLTLLNQISIAAAGATFTCGSSTFTFSNSGATVWSLTAAATISCGSATFVLNNPSSTGNAMTFAAGTSKTYGTLTVNSHASGQQVTLTLTTGATFANMNMNGPLRFNVPAGVTVTSGLTLTGTSSGLVNFAGPINTGTPATLTVTGATLSAAWAAVQNVSFTGGSLSSSNSTALFDLGGNTGVTGVAPSGGSGIIGGGL
jgi:hypothetical protein